MGEVAEAFAGMAPRILCLDIETAPAIAHVWGLYNQNVGLNQIVEPGRVLCFAARWHNQKQVMYWSEFHDGRAAMLDAAERLLTDADIIVHYNGTRFDLPHLRTALALDNRKPVPPVREVDLLRVVRRVFKFQSNKLDFVAQQLGLGGKVKHEGHDLWVKCLAGDPKAWDRMRRYNKRDVDLTFDLYDRLSPWIPTHPHYGLWTREEASCPRCGSTNLTHRGWTRTAVTTYARMQCECGGWVRMNHVKARTTTRPVT